MLASYLVLGIGLGAASSVLPGPCGLAVLDAASRSGLRRGIATSVGAALGDMTYATLGVFGLGQILAAHDGALHVLRLLGGCVLIAFGLWQLRRKRPGQMTDGGALGGVLVGWLTLLASPGALVTWVLLLGSQLGDASAGAQVAAILGIGTGTTAWFSGVAVLASRGRQVLGSPRVARVSGCLLVLYGLVSIARGA